MTTAIVPEPREPNGRAKRPTPSKAERDIMSVAMNNPERRGRKNADDPRHGYAIGRLYLAGILSRDQFDALTWVTKITVRHMREITGSLPRFPSILANQIGGFGGTAPELDADDVFGIRRDMGDVDEALSDHPSSFSFHEAKAMIMQVCILDRSPLDERGIGTLRLIANALDRLRNNSRKRR